MTKYTITDAAKQAGVSRSHFYKKYIKTGAISIDRDNDGNPMVDAAELFRVFGNVFNPVGTTVDKIHNLTSENTSENAELRMEVKLLREQLEATKDDKRWLQDKVDQLSSQLETATRLLDHQPQAKKKRWWWF